MFRASGSTSILATLSILITTLWRRHDLLGRLLKVLEPQIYDQPVEILYVGDNRRRTTGAKRNDLLRMSRGNYVTFVDDDDRVADDYVSQILGAMKQDPDIISWNLMCYRDGWYYGDQPYRCYTELESGSHKVQHTSGAWRGSVARSVLFSEVNFGEDFPWARAVEHKFRKDRNIREVHIDKALYIWDWSSQRTEFNLQGHDSYCVNEG